DPTPADQNGKFTYTIDWGDGHIQKVQGPATTQVTHAYAAAGTYTPSVSVVDQDHRASGTARLAPAIARAALDARRFRGSLRTAPVPLVAGTSTQMSLALGVINATLPNTWQNAQNNPVNLKVSTDALVDLEINPTSPSAQINISQDHLMTLPLNALFDVSNPY